jgi:site-specific DNA recombinase
VNSRTSPRELDKLVQAIIDGVPGTTVRDKIAALEARKVAPKATLADPKLPALHSNMANVYRRRVETLAAGLESDDRRDATRQALRGFIDRIEIPADTNALLTVVGNFGEMLNAATGRTADAAAVGNVGCGGGI